VPSYEKIVKYIVEKIQHALSPLEKIVENQEIIIEQNARIQETLDNIYHKQSGKTGCGFTRPDNLSECDMKICLSESVDEK
jgi:hypothetical protein